MLCCITVLASFRLACATLEFPEADGRILVFSPLRKTMKPAEFSSVVLFTIIAYLCGFGTDMASGSS